MWATFLEFMGENRWPLTFLSALGLLLIALFLVRKSFDPAKKIGQMQRQGTFSRLKKRFRKLCSDAMGQIAHLPVVGDTAANMKETFLCQYATTEDTALYLTGRCLVVCAAAMVVSFVGSMFYFKDVVLSIIAAVMLSRVVYQSLQGNPEQFLQDMEDSMDDFIHAYHANGGNLDAAFAHVINSASHVAGHWAKMHDYIQCAYASQNPESIQKEYYSIAPSRFFRNLYTCIYMTYKYGDTEENGVSTFTTNFYRIEEDVIDKINNINKLKNGLFGEKWFIILPVFALPLLSVYMVKYFSFEGFELVEEFVNSPVGYTVEIICAAVSLLSYFVYEKMTDNMVIEPKKVLSWEGKLLRNPRIYRFVQKVMPKGSKKRKNLKDMLLKAGSTESVDAFTLRRYAATIFVIFICAISLGINNLTTIHSIKNNIYQGLAQESYEEVLLSQNDTQAFIDEQIKADKENLKYIKTINGWYSMSEDDQRDALTKHIRKETAYDYRGYYSDAVTRIISKANMIHQTGGLMNLMFILIFCFGTFYTPLIMVFMQALMNQENLISDETADLQSMTVMLISHKTTTPQQLLNWFADSAVLFAAPCYKTAISGNFEPMFEATTYKPFRQLTDCLKYACEGMPMDEAFADLTQKMAIQKSEKVRMNEKDIKNRISRVEMCSTLSMGAAMALYMFMPILVAMVSMFKDFSSMM